MPVQVRRHVHFPRTRHEYTSTSREPVVARCFSGETPHPVRGLTFNGLFLLAFSFSTTVASKVGPNGWGLKADADGSVDHYSNALGEVPEWVFTGEADHDWKDYDGKGGCSAREREGRGAKSEGRRRRRRDGSRVGSALSESRIE
jgi:hypothetical protein